MGNFCINPCVLEKSPWPHEHTVDLASFVCTHIFLWKRRAFWRWNHWPLTFEHIPNITQLTIASWNMWIKQDGGTAQIMRMLNGIFTQTIFSISLINVDRYWWSSIYALSRCWQALWECPARSRGGKLGLQSKKQRQTAWARVFCAWLPTPSVGHTWT